MNIVIQMQKNNQNTRNLLPLTNFEGSLANKVYLVLRTAILSLVYHPGEILRKREICGKLGVSRSPVSEAIAILASEGLVNVVPKAGTYVSLFSMDEIKEGAFLREALELAAVEYLVDKITDDQLAQLYQNLGEQEALISGGDFDAFYVKDSKMHELIMSFTGFKRLRTLAESSWVQVNRARHLNLPSPGRIQETVNEHRNIIKAIEAGNHQQARTATRNHLRQLIKYLEPLEIERPELFEPS